MGKKKIGHISKWVFDVLVSLQLGDAAEVELPPGPVERIDWGYKGRINKRFLMGSLEHMGGGTGCASSKPSRSGRTQSLQLRSADGCASSGTLT